MATWKAAVCLAALLASTTVYAKPSSPTGRNRPQQAATNAETYCKVSALVSHDAILARLNDEKPDDTKTHLRFIAFGMISNPREKSCCLVDSKDKHARCHWVQCARVTNSACMS